MCSATIKHILIPIWFIAISVVRWVWKQNTFSISTWKVFLTNLKQPPRCQPFVCCHSKGAGAQLDSSSPSYCLHISTACSPAPQILYMKDLVQYEPLSSEGENQQEGCCEPFSSSSPSLSQLLLSLLRGARFVQSLLAESHFNILSHLAQILEKSMYWNSIKGCLGKKCKAFSLMI